MSIEECNDALKVSREGRIAVLTMNNPPRLNAISLAMRLALVEALTGLFADDRCRAIVLTGAGSNFTAGGDISEMQPRAVIEGRMRVELMTRIFRMLASGPKPIVTAVEGKAFGAGVSFAAASDYAVAASDAKFSCAFIKVGLIADGGAIWSLARKIGARKTMELCAFAEPFDAAAAREMQLVNEVCEPGMALTQAMEAAEKFARNPPVAMALLKAALNGGNETLEQAVSNEMSYVSTLMNTQDFAEAIAAFKEKRSPVFTGK